MNRLRFSETVFVRKKRNEGFRVWELYSLVFKRQVLPPLHRLDGLGV